MDHNPNNIHSKQKMMRDIKNMNMNMNMNMKSINTIRILNFRSQNNQKEVRMIIPKKMIITGEEIISDSECIKINDHNIDINIKCRLFCTKSINIFLERFTKPIPNCLAPSPLILNLYKGNIIKDMSETASAITQLFKFIRENFKHIKHKITNNTNIVALIAGDGVTPKTGYPLSILTTWKIYSVDPLMNVQWQNQTYCNNLTCSANTIENFVAINDINTTLKNCDMIIIIGVHAHVNFNDLWPKLKKYGKPLILLSILCCKPTKTKHH